MSFEAWVTDSASNYLAHLERSHASPFRRFAVSRMPGADPGVGSLEHHLDNQLLRDVPTLLADDNLVHMRYNGRTVTWVIEERTAVLDEGEHATDWVVVSGRGVKQLLADRIVWPTKFSETALDPALWGIGDWRALLDASAASGQKVVPVDLTAGAVVGDPVQITGGGNSHVGIIASIDPNTSVTLVDNLDATFPAGSRIVSAARQWRRFVYRPAGEMLWDLITESNPRFATQILRGTIETDGADGWTQDLRFDNLLDDVAADVVDTYGDVDMDGLTFSYYSDPGALIDDQVIFEEGADILSVERQSSIRDKLTWVLAEGLGEGVTAKLKFSFGSHGTRRREAFLEAKDVANLNQLLLAARAARLQRQRVDAIGLSITEDRYRVFEDFDLHDRVRVIAPSRGIDETLRIVAIYLAERDDERVEVSIDVNTKRQDALLTLDERQKTTRSSLGVRNRQPQGQLVPFSFSGADVFDTTDTMDVFVFVPDRMYICLEARALLRFREFFAAAKSAASSGSLTSDSGGGSTSGASSSSSTSGGGHFHLIAPWSSNTPGGFTTRKYNGRRFSGGSTFLMQLDLATDTSGGDWITDDGDTGHTHGISHTHSTPDHSHTVPGHTHGLTYGVFKETFPGSHSVTLKVYELVAGAWTLRGTVGALTDDIEDVDLTAFITGPGNWRLELKSDAAQPNGGRLGCDVSGYVLGAIQSA